jgi:hypothetical protein
MDELEFWRECCRRGIAIYQVPRPFREEEEMVWLAEKNRSFADRTAWEGQYTFETIEDVFHWVGKYLTDGIDPKAYSERE